MGIDVAEIKLLRKKTEAGMQDCLRALSETKGDSAAAEVLLKEWGLAGVEKRAARETKEGRVFAHVMGSSAALVEIACETDFVSRNEAFSALGLQIAEEAWRKRIDAPDSEIGDLVAAVASVVKENIAVRRMAFMDEGSGGHIAAYVHGDGKIGVLLRAKADRPEAFGEAKVRTFFHDLALHVAAFGPLFVDEESIPEAYKEEKAEQFRKEIDGDEALRAKPAKIVEGVMAGRIRKHLSGITLLGHGFVKDEKVPVSKVLQDLMAETGHALSIEGFACFKVDDGL